MDKKILEITVEEKDGEFVIRLAGERAEEWARRFGGGCGCGCCCRRPGEGEGKGRGGCC